jgi:indolepyruvate ferredoxin oxidoreductase beta subunit
MIRSGKADVMLAMDEAYLDAYLYLMSPKGAVFLNAVKSDAYLCIDATGTAARMGSPVVANLVLLGFALKNGGLFCDYPGVQSVIRRVTPDPLLDLNLKALDAGFGG